MSDLKPCPFCGSENIDMDINHFIRRGAAFFMKCENCDSRGPWIYFDSFCEDKDKKNQCIEVWNERK